MSFQISGKLIKIYDENQINASFKKREFVIEKTENNFTDYIKFQLVQDKTDIISAFKLGDEITVDFNIKGNQWKDSYFVNLQAWRIKTADNNTAPATSSESFPSLEDIPPENDSDDLPF
jgi:single-strand DNA-binding protein